MTILFVTGSGTEIGKTAISAALVRALRADGWPCSAYKPVVSGFDARAAAASDTGVLLAAQSRSMTPAELDAVSPWRFREPLSADAAARREGRRIELDGLVRFCRRVGADDLAIIEGIGGIMAPLGDTETVLDWILALDAPTLLIVGSYLGALSHALTAVRVLQTCGVGLVAIAVNQSANEPMPTAETAATLERLVPSTAVVSVARAAAGAAPDVSGLLPHLLPLVRRKKESPPAGEATGRDKR